MNGNSSHPWRPGGRRGAHTEPRSTPSKTGPRPEGFHRVAEQGRARNLLLIQSCHFTEEEIEAPNEKGT